ncbi:MAG: SPOR domain-containing protein [Pseudomonadota bacterium]
MADFTASPGRDTYIVNADATTAQESIAERLAYLTNVAGALVSIALIIGIGVWAYQLLIRDVSGIPVVRAAEGEMRVRPDDPGGVLAQHQGLAVNRVAAEGGAGANPDRLILAPKPIDLAQEDEVLAPQVTAPGAEEAAASETPARLLGSEEIVAALQSGNVDALVDELTAGVAPLTAEPAETDPVAAAVAKAVEAEVSALEEAVAALRNAPGLKLSYRPQLRPISLSRPAAPAAAEPTVREVAADAVPVGTRLAQLGAYESVEVARTQWDQIAARFDVYMASKARVVQRASSGGRTFYRLRAMGFEDLADARRFCAALVAQNADCIPVVTR